MSRSILPNWHVSLAYLDLVGQVARTLLDLSKQTDYIEKRESGISFSISRQELARIVGNSDEETDLALESIQAQGLIVLNGDVIEVIGHG